MYLEHSSLNLPVEVTVVHKIVFPDLLWFNEEYRIGEDVDPIARLYRAVQGTDMTEYLVPAIAVIEETNWDSASSLFVP